MAKQNAHGDAGCALPGCWNARTFQQECGLQASDCIVDPTEPDFKRPAPRWRVSKKAKVEVRQTLSDEVVVPFSTVACAYVTLAHYPLSTEPRCC